MVVLNIDGNGYINVRALGGLRPVSLISQRVIIHGKKDIQGVIAPGAGQEDKAPKVDDLLIDTGLPAKEVMRLVEPGNPVSPAQEFLQLNKKILMARNFDDRMGTFCLLEAMSRVGPTEAEVYAVSTTQEEVGTRGIETAAYAIQPEVGLAIDGSMPHSAHIPRNQRTCEMGDGAGIYLIDGLTIGSPKLIEHLFALGKKYKIACQKNIGGGTDAHKIQRMGRGCLCTTVGVPTRYMHSTVQLCHEGEAMTFFKTVCGMFLDCRFLHYNLPRAQRIIAGPEYRRIADEVPNLVATKNSSTDYARTADLMTHVPDIQHFFLEGNFAMGCTLGECSLLCSWDVLFPKTTWRFFEAGLKKDVDELFRITELLREVGNALFAHCTRDMIDGSYDKTFIRLRKPHFSNRL